jgi:putative membrane protein
LLSWLLKKYRDQTLAILTGFIAGSLAIIWPWKNKIKSIKIDDKIITKEYENYIPKEINMENFIALIMIISGILIVYLIERNSKEKK